MGVSTPSDNSSSDNKGMTLYDRLGGDSFINILTCSFFDEIVENEDLRPFFKNISVAALKTHQVKLFRVIFGKDEEKPEEEDLLDFMLKTHTRLFRELGLDATHFDQVAGCFVQGLQTFQIAQGLIDECVAILVPLRVVFEYGAEVAAREKAMDASELKNLPKACAKTMGTAAQAVLPEYSKIDIPDWLPAALKKCSNTSNVRAWTCALTDRFGAEGDEFIADTFLDQPYMDHHIYLVALMQLAFSPEDIEDKQRQQVLKIVQYPRGRKCHRLSRALYGRMVDQFLLTCAAMGVQSHDIRLLEIKMKKYTKRFSKKNYRVGGVRAPHILRKVEEEDPPLLPRNTNKKEISKERKVLVLSKLVDGSATDFDDATSMASSRNTSKGSLASLSSMNSSPEALADEKKTKRNSKWGWLRGKKKCEPSRDIPATVAA